LVVRSPLVVVALVIAVIGARAEGLAQEGAAGLVAHVVRPVHPILIRNEQGPLL
jgi:hypothetical protein